MRIQIPVLGLEFEEEGDTLWVHSPKGATVLRIKSMKGFVVDKECQNSVAHADITVEGPVHICVPEEEDRTDATDRLMELSEERAEELKDFLMMQKMAIAHCDEEPDEIGLCECMHRLADWWVEQQYEKDTLRMSTISEVVEALQPAHTAMAAGSVVQPKIAPNDKRWELAATVSTACASLLESAVKNMLTPLPEAKEGVNLLRYAGGISVELDGRNALIHDKSGSPRSRVYIERADLVEAISALITIANTVGVGPQYGIQEEAGEDNE